MPVFLLLQVSEAQKERKEREERYMVREFCWVTECCRDIVDPYEVRSQVLEPCSGILTSESFFLFFSF